MAIRITCDYCNTTLDRNTLKRQAFIRYHDIPFLITVERDLGSSGLTLAERTHVDKHEGPYGRPAGSDFCKTCAAKIIQSIDNADATLY